MKINNLFTILVLFSIFVSGCFASDSDSKKFAVIDEFLTQISAQGFSGSVLVSDGSNVFSKGYGMADREGKVKVDENTVFDIGSVTKQFTGAAILKLEMQGKLSVADTIGKYLLNVPADKRAITIHHLLTHTSGLPPSIGNDYDVLERDAFLEKTWVTSLGSKPGEKYEYSNVGYSVLAAIIEVVSGKSYEQFLHDSLFLPAKMTQTGYKLPKWKPAQIAVGYRDENKWGKPNDKPWGKDAPYWNLLGNGGILSTTGDLLRWHQALLSDEILNKQAKEKYYKRHVEEGPGAGTFYGYGWALFPTPRNTTLVTHNGGNGIFFCDFLRYVDENLTIILMTNAARREFRGIPREIASVFFRPDYKPSMNITAPASTSSLATHPQRGLIESFIKTITAGDPKAIESFVSQHFTAALMKFAPMERHREMLTNVGKDIRSAEINSVSTNGDRTTIGFKNLPIKMTLVIENGKIGGLQLED